MSAPLFRLFDVPVAARFDSSGGLAGGLGTGSFRFGPDGRFRDWRLEPFEPANPQPVEHDRFHVWTGQGRKVMSRALVGETAFRSATLFPFTWTAYDLDSMPLVLESTAFSPLLTGDAPERSLPLYLVVFRAHNPTEEPIEAALMLTWVCGWPNPVNDSTFDFQHDNLCLTGSLGSPDSPNRQGIAVPDLHYMGIYQQGIEPWQAPTELDAVLEDFAQDGELDPRVVRSTPHGAAAWVKFDLESGETKEVPFVLAWHFPTYQAGPYAGKWRNYSQYLGRYRPDNAIVWLAEQAVQHYGAETANYRYWMQQLADWHAELGAGASEVCAALESVIRAGTIWQYESGVEVVDDISPHTLDIAAAVRPDIRPRGG